MEMKIWCSIFALFFHFRLLVAKLELYQEEALSERGQFIRRLRLKPRREKSTDACFPRRESDWTYYECVANNEIKSPLFWHEKYSMCGSRFQSPINIVQAIVVTDCPTLKFEFNRGICENKDLIFNPSIRGWDIYFMKDTCIEPPSLMTGGSKFILDKFQFHSKSEHEIDGESFDGELQLVHLNANDVSDIIVISVMLKVNHELEGTSELEEYIYYMTQESEQITKSRGASMHLNREADVSNPYSMLPVGGSFYFYLGSLTSPPCAEDVKWMIMTEPLLISPLSYASLYGGIKNNKESLVNSQGTNVRPLQALNDRDIHICHL